MIVHLEDPIVSAQIPLKSISNYSKSQDIKSMCKRLKNFYKPITDLKRAKSRMNCHSKLLQREKNT